MPWLVKREKYLHAADADVEGLELNGWQVVPEGSLPAELADKPAKKKKKKAAPKKKKAAK